MEFRTLNVCIIFYGLCPMASLHMITERKLYNLAKKIFTVLKLENVATEIILLPHADMAAMKRRFFKKQTEPNVISFRNPAIFPHPEIKRKRHLGEIFLNRDILARQPERTAHLLAHGILHLAGHDHKKKADALKMERLERKILKTLEGAKGRGVR